MATLSWRVASQ